MILEIGPKIIIGFIIGEEMPTYYNELKEVDITTVINISYNHLLNIHITSKEPTNDIYYDTVELIENRKLHLFFTNEKNESLKTKWLDNVMFLEILNGLEKVYF